MSDQKTIVVSGNGTCFSMRRTPLRPGTILKVVEERRNQDGIENPKSYEIDEVPQRIASDWIKSGFAHLPGQPSVPLVMDGAMMTPDGVKGIGNTSTVADPNSVRVNDHGPWVLDPDGLRGFEVEELNAMIGDRLGDDDRASFEPYTSADDAIAHLSRDFEMVQQKQQKARVATS